MFVLVGDVQFSGLQFVLMYQCFIVKYCDGSVLVVNIIVLVFLLKSVVVGLVSSQGCVLGLQEVCKLVVGLILVRIDWLFDQVEFELLMCKFVVDLNVEYVEVDQIMCVMLILNDICFSEQWGFGIFNVLINVWLVWDKVIGIGVVVVVIDIGIINYFDFNVNILFGYDFISDVVMVCDGGGCDNNLNDEGDWYGVNECGLGILVFNFSWYGIYVVGIVVVVINNSIGVVGIVFNVKVVLVCVLGKCGGYIFDIVDVIVWVFGGIVSGVLVNVNLVEVINMLLGGGGSCFIIYQNVINGVVSCGIIVVVVVGNSNINVFLLVLVNCLNVIVVVVIILVGVCVSFFNYGIGIDILVLGQSILFMFNIGIIMLGSVSYVLYNGILMVVLYVVGVVVLMQLVVLSLLSLVQVESIIKSIVCLLLGVCLGGCGVGIVDVNVVVVVVINGGGNLNLGGNVLQNNVLVIGLGVVIGVELNYIVVVLVGSSQLCVMISGGSGDVDLYVCQGSVLIDISYICCFYLSGNSEICMINSFVVGMWYVWVKVYSIFLGLIFNVQY